MLISPIREIVGEEGINKIVGAGTKVTVNIFAGTNVNERTLNSISRLRSSN